VGFLLLIVSFLRTIPPVSSLPFSERPAVQRKYPEGKPQTRGDVQIMKSRRMRRSSRRASNLRVGIDGDVDVSRITWLIWLLGLVAAWQIRSLTDDRRAVWANSFTDQGAGTGEPARQRRRHLKTGPDRGRCLAVEFLRMGNPRGHSMILDAHRGSNSYTDVGLMMNQQTHAKVSSTFQPLLPRVKG
jgi:hypothetical protein